MKLYFFDITDVSVIHSLKELGAYFEVWCSPKKTSIPRIGESVAINDKLWEIREIIWVDLETVYLLVE